MAPVACEAMVASALRKDVVSCDLIKAETIDLRGLIIFASRPHDNVGRRSLGCEGPIVGLLASGGLFEESDDVVGNTAKISLAVRGDDAEQALASLLGQVGLLENTLRRVDVGQVERCAGMARVKNGSQPYTCMQGADHDSVHLIICDVPMLPKIDRINDFVISIRLITVEVLCLPTMA